MTESPDPDTDRRRRRSASRPAGPPSAVPAPGAVPAPAPGDTAGDPAGVDAADVDAVDVDAAGAAPVDPVERSDRRRRRRQKAKRSRAERDAERDADGAGAGATAGASTGTGTGDPAAVEPPDRKPASRSADRRSDADRRRSGSERALRGLEGGRDTQISTTDAMRAREWATPTAEDLAEADRDLVLVRRNYRPPAPLQTTRRRGGTADRPAPDGPGASPER